MRCPDCGIENKNTATFCQKCGRKLVRSSDIFRAPTSIKGDMDSSSPVAPVTRQQPGSGSGGAVTRKPGKSSDSMLPPAPETLKDGRYIILKMLGAGGMGRVFLARDATMDFHVVVKEMLPFYTTREDKEYLETRFKEEAKLLFRLKHQSLPRVTDYFVEDGRSYLIMEFVEGKDLEKVAADYPKCQVGKKEVVLWMWSVLDILRYLHSQDPPIIHRDIKPANMMLTQKGEVFLVDFGVARALGKNTLTSVGTPGFASMDHFTGDYSASSDLYSTGATFHYLLSGENPQDRKNFHFPPLNKYRDDIPDGLQRIISRMLAMKKEARYNSAEEVMRDMVVIIKGITGEDPPGLGFSPIAAPAEPQANSAGAAEAGRESASKPSGSLKSAPRPMSRASGTLGAGKTRGKSTAGMGSGKMVPPVKPGSGRMDKTPSTREMSSSRRETASMASPQASGTLPPSPAITLAAEEAKPGTVDTARIKRDTGGKRENKTLKHIIIVLLLLVIPSCWAISKLAKFVKNAVPDEPTPGTTVATSSPADLSDIDSVVEKELEKELGKDFDKIPGGDIDIDPGEIPAAPNMKENLAKLKNYIKNNPRRINLKDKKGNALLHKAAASGQAEAVRFLLSRNAKVDIIDNGGRTPLHFAALTGNPEVIKILLSNKANINFKDKEGNTPLHYASIADKPAIVLILLNNGARVNEKNRSGYTPLDIAVQTGNVKMAELLTKKGGIPGRGPMPVKDGGM